MVLSTLVLIGSLYIQTKFIAPKQAAKAEAQAKEMQLKNEEQKALISAENELISASAGEDGQIASEVVSEENFTIETDKVKVVFTNRGGDVISYKLKEHKDKETSDGVEMVKSLTDSNRAFALAFGGAEHEVLNDLFTTVVKDDKTILFHREYEIKDENGNPHKFILGKRYSFKDGDYAFKLDVSVSSKENNMLLDLGGFAYTLRTAPQIGPAFSKKDRYEVRQFLALNGSKKVRKSIGDKFYDLANLQWAGVGGKYFTMLVKPVSMENMSTNVKVVNKSSNADNAQIYLSRKTITEKTVNDTYYVYVGPRQESELIKYNDKAKNVWSLSNVKFNMALSTSGFLSGIEVVLKWSLEKINIPVRNWGISIIILTILLKLLLFPLNRKQAMGTLKMQALQPRMKELQDKYKNDQQKLGLEMQKLYKQVGYNPMSGCLPMIAQMLILFSLYNVFNNYFEFRGAGFIKGWIDDLSVGDTIFTWNKNIFLISGFTMNNLRLLPFIYTASQLLSGKITQFGNAGMGANQGQMKFMMYGMPIMFFFMFYNVPSGLLLYWISSNILQIGQQLLINRYMNKKRKEMETVKPVNKNELKFKGGKKKTR